MSDLSDRSEPAESESDVRPSAAPPLSDADIAGMRQAAREIGDGAGRKARELFDKLQAELLAAEAVNQSALETSIVLVDATRQMRSQKTTHKLTSCEDINLCDTFENAFSSAKTGLSSPDDD